MPFGLGKTLGYGTALLTVTLAGHFGQLASAQHIGSLKYSDYNLQEFNVDGNPVTAASLVDAQNVALVGGWIAKNAHLFTPDKLAQLEIALRGIAVGDWSGFNEWGKDPATEEIANGIRELLGFNTINGQFSYSGKDSSDFSPDESVANRLDTQTSADMRERALDEYLQSTPEDDDACIIEAIEATERARPDVIINRKRYRACLAYNSNEIFYVSLPDTHKILTLEEAKEHDSSSPFKIIGRSAILTINGESIVLVLRPKDEEAGDEEAPIVIPESEIHHYKNKPASGNEETTYFNGVEHESEPSSTSLDIC